MTYVERIFMGLDSHEPRDRLSAFLRRQYPREHATKRLADDLACTPKAAENILTGHWPNSRLWAAIARRFGDDVLAAVFGPEIDETVARLQTEVRDLEDRLAETRRRARQAEGVSSRRPHRVATDQTRAPR
jgi:hypothetical protein